MSDISKPGPPGDHRARCVCTRLALQHNCDGARALRAWRDTLAGLDSALRRSREAAAALVASLDAGRDGEAETRAWQHARGVVVAKKRALSEVLGGDGTDMVCDAADRLAGKVPT